MAGTGERDTRTGSADGQPETKNMMLGVADDYGHLAQIAEAMALIRGVLASAMDDETR
jgi:hypothetical protein